MSDLIERQAAIEYLITNMSWYSEDGYETDEAEKRSAITDLINGVPSVQPEIIMCRECKWYGRADKRRFYRGMDCLQHRIDTIVPDKDFCSLAERRKNEN